MMTDFLCLDFRMGTSLMTMMMTMMMLRTSLKMRCRCSVCELLTLNCCILCSVYWCSIHATNVICFVIEDFFHVCSQLFISRDVM